MSRNYLLALLSGLLAAIAVNASALPEDHQQPINIQADRATQQTFPEGERTEYFGSVVMTQGSLLVNADHLVIRSVDRKVTTIHATGKPARFQQQSTPGQAPVVARANQIDYQLATEIVVLIDDAHIDQPDASFSGNRIEYHVGSEEVVAEDRVNMIFTPAAPRPKPATPQPDKDNNGETDG